jgi:hypothetical protein
MACWAFTDWVKWAKDNAIPYYGSSIDGVMDTTQERFDSVGVSQFTEQVREIYDGMKIGGTLVGTRPLTPTVRAICSSQI